MDNLKEFHNVTGEPVYINIDNITYIQKSATHNGAIISVVTGAAFEVRETLHEVAAICIRSKSKTAIQG